MTPLNLSVVFAPTIMRPLSIEREMTDMQAQRMAVQALLEHADTIFDSAESAEWATERIFVSYWSHQKRSVSILHYTRFVAHVATRFTPLLVACLFYDRLTAPCPLARRLGRRRVGSLLFPWFISRTSVLISGGVLSQSGCSMSTGGHGWVNWCLCTSKPAQMNYRDAGPLYPRGAPLLSGH